MYISLHTSKHIYIYEIKHMRITHIWEHLGKDITDAFVVGTTY